MWSLNQMFHSPLSLSSRGSLVPLHFLPWEWCHLHIWGYWYFSWEILIPVCASSSWAFLMMYSAYELSNQGDNLQPWHTPFLIWNQSAVPCSVLAIASWPAYRFLRRQIRWSGIPVSVGFPQFVVIHTVKGFCKVNEAEVGVFLPFSCFFYDPEDVGNLISGSSAFSQSSLNIWNFIAYVLLKTCLEKLLW